MCGIAGLITKNGGPADQAVVRRMTDAVAHRGPNGGDVLVDGPVGFGHRRLSVIDLSSGGAQPMFYADGRVSVIYNGEIYNYIELREELRSMGYSFSSQSDTEVLLAAYCAWGEDCVTHFNGMWAFALHDRRTGTVFCSRDRFGVKPFYYIDTPEAFAFGSEIRQLLPFLNDRRANMDVVATFIVTGAADLDENCFFTGVKKLMGGHSLVYDIASRTFRINRFYQIRQRDEVSRLSLDEATEFFSGQLSDAVRLRMRSDVKVGTCLSGGLDSSSVATLASEAYRNAGGGAFSAITAVSEQASNNESHFAEMVVDSSRLEWHRTQPSYQDFVDTLPAVVETQEEPFGSPSVSMQYFVMKTARANGITVLLDGQGGDETLLGYEKYYAAYIARMFRSKGVFATLSLLRSTMKNNAKMRPHVIAKYLFGGLLASARYGFYKREHGYFQHHNGLPAHLAAFSKACTDEFRLQELEIRSTNLPVLLRYEDKNSMSQAIEARLPFLDYRLLETSLSLPAEYKMRDGWTKWILRRTMKGKMPDEIIWRKNKFGFEAPDAIWLKKHASEMEGTVLRSPLVGHFADLAKLKTVYPMLDGRGRWRLYSLALWEQAFRVNAAA